jgi:hypothetical protein
MPAGIFICHSYPKGNGAIGMNYRNLLTMKRIKGSDYSQFSRLPFCGIVAKRKNLYFHSYSFFENFCRPLFLVDNVLTILIKNPDKPVNS